eukprot:Sspe_Gene.17068::Locus_6053_Transcript_1_1_Confidence_1.000_Length_978::g.17068::m.17068/K09503/DNAJA2; DnaJ homolog subfamily A member 2
MQFAMDPSDMARMMMGGVPMGMRGGYGMPRKPETIGVEMEVTLEELYTGTEKELDLDEMGDDELKELGVAGKITVPIPAGTPNRKKIKLPGAGIKHPELPEPGDLVVAIRCKEHDRFRRVGHDLEVKVGISLAQALVGFAVELQHLDGSTLLVRSKDTTPIAPLAKRSIKGKGMPICDTDPVEHGDLIVIFNVEFPRVLEDEQVALLKTLLPGRKMIPHLSPDLPVSECELEDYNPEEWKRSAIGEEEEDDEDDDHQRVVCTHQ